MNAKEIFINLGNNVEIPINEDLEKALLKDTPGYKVIKDYIEQLEKENEELKKQHQIDDIRLLQYASLRENLDTTVKCVFGDNYYNSGMDVYSCDAFLCRDIIYKCGKESIKNYIAFQKEKNRGCLKDE